MKSYDIASFNSSLSTKPYCTNELILGLRIRPLAQALKYKYIQTNDNYIKFLVVDCDHDDFYIWERKNLAPPNFIVKNRENGHFHAIWALSDPIYKDYIHKAKNLAYFAKVQQVYTEMLGGDKNYINLIAKNPNHEYWQTVLINRFYPYSLDELSDYIKLPQKITKKRAMGEGRNCYLFEMIRIWAYSEVRFYKAHQANLTDFYNVILHRLEKLNIFDNAPSLSCNELKTIAKSVAKWTWINFTTEKFSEIQRNRAKKERKSRRLKTEIREGFLNEYDDHNTSKQAH